MVAAAPKIDDSAAPSLDAACWLKILILGGLFVWAYYFQFSNLVQRWRHDPNWSHGFLIPLFSLYMLYSRREKLLAATRKTNPLGLVILVAGLVAMVLTVYPIRTPFLTQLTMIVVLFGMVLYLAGWGVMKVAWISILYLALAIPWPNRLYDALALPLQRLAAASSGEILSLFGVSIQVTALHLDLISANGVAHQLTVAEACSGVRSLMAFVALGVAMAWIEERPPWQRAVLVLAGLPIAVLCNILRVTLTSTMFYIDKPQFGQKVMHEFMGLVLLIPALIFLLLISRLMNMMYEDDDEDEDEPEEDGAGGREERAAGRGRLSERFATGKAGA
jgi:exosortase